MIQTSTSLLNSTGNKTQPSANSTGLFMLLWKSGEYKKNSHLNSRLSVSENNKQSNLQKLTASFEELFNLDRALKKLRFLWADIQVLTLIVKEMPTNWETMKIAKETASSKSTELTASIQQEHEKLEKLLTSLVNSTQPDEKALWEQAKLLWSPDLACLNGAMKPGQNNTRFGAGSSEGEIVSTKATSREISNFQRELQRKTFLAALTSVTDTQAKGTAKAKIMAYFEPEHQVAVAVNTTSSARLLPTTVELTQNSSVPSQYQTMVTSACSTTQPCSSIESSDNANLFP